MYRVIKEFTDLQDGHFYKEGDTFPQNGTKVSEARIAKLAGSKNRQGTPLIIEEGAVKKDVGLNSASPVQSEGAVQESFSKNNEGEGEIISEKSKRGRKKKED